MIRYDLQGGIIKPFWFPFASVYVPVTPCVLDGSLSFLEMVWKILKDLNKVAEATNNNHIDILTLANQIEILYNTKLTYTEVTFTENNGTYSSDKTFAQIKAAFNEGIVIGREKDVDQFYIALGISGSGVRETVRFYSLDQTTLCEFAVSGETVIKSRIALITENGGTIIGTLLLPDRDPVYPTEAVNKQYVDNGLAGKQDILTWDTTPTDGSSNPVTSDGIYDALSGKQDTLTFDSTPTDGSSNPVTSDGIYDAITASVTTAKDYADNKFQIRNAYYTATRTISQSATTITCDLDFSSIMAFNAQNRVMIIKVNTVIDSPEAYRAYDNEWFWFAGLKYDANGTPTDAVFISFTGKLECSSLNGWSFTAS